jgi:hypothetical protein
VARFEAATTNPFLRCPVEVAVMRPTEGHGELIAHFLSKSALLREPQMVRVARLAAAHEAGLFGDKA